MKPRILAAVFLIITGLARAEVITIEAGAPAHPFPHFWEKMFGSGRAILSLRDDYRRDLRTVKAATGFEYVRFHAIFGDDVGLYRQDEDGNVSFNFSYVDQIYDGLLSNGVRPFVELSFMPNQLAAGDPADFFWYKPNPSPPRDNAIWVKMIDAFVRHLEQRYGANEVQQWYFEVWNEPNLPFWTGEPKEDRYYQLYDMTAKAIKQIDTKLRVGGPSTAQAAWVDHFIAHCRKAGVPFDFVSTHIYGNEANKDVFGTDGPVDIKHMVPRALTKVREQVKASEAPDTPIIISEFNAAYLNQVNIEDSAFMGPWMANTIRQCDGLTTMMSYWTFSDVFEEQGVVKTPFYGGFGLIAERNIPKASLRAFELLHELGDQRIDNPSENAIVTRRADGTVIAAIWNYSEPGTAGIATTINLDLRGGKSTKYKLQRLNGGHGSSLEAWLKMGKPDYPTRDQIADLIKSSQLEAPTEHLTTDAIYLVPHELVLVQWKP